MLRELKWSTPEQHRIQASPIMLHKVHNKQVSVDYSHLTTTRNNKFRFPLELGRYNNVLKESRIRNVCQQLNNTNVIDCEYLAFLNVLNMILLDKCIYLTGIYMVQKLRISMLFYLLKTQAL